jgi:hypothetical protein
MRTAWLGVANDGEDLLHELAIDVCLPPQSLVARLDYLVGCVDLDAEDPMLASVPT